MKTFDLVPRRGIAALMAVLAVTGCGSGDDSKGVGTGGANSAGGAGAGGGNATGGAGSPGGTGPGGCTPPVLEGSPFGADGTATLTGAGTLPDGIADGLELQVEVTQGSVTFGVLADNLFTENDRICGKSFRYTVHKLSAGTYRLGFVVFDTNSDSTDPKYEGQAPSDFTIMDGQTLMLDSTFTLK